MQNRVTTGKELRTLIHEIGHVFKAKDHYYSEEVATKYDDDNLHSTDTLNDLDENDATYNSYCIYGEERSSVNGLTMCAGCYERIQNHASIFNTTEG